MNSRADLDRMYTELCAKLGDANIKVSQLNSYMRKLENQIAEILSEASALEKQKLQNEQNAQVNELPNS